MYRAVKKLIKDVEDEDEGKILMDWIVIIDLVKK